MISTDKITEIFFEIDEFCKVFEPAFNQRLLEDGKKRRKRAFKMSMSEILTITVIFQLSGHRTFKHFYLYSTDSTALIKVVNPVKSYCKS